MDYKKVIEDFNNGTLDKNKIQLVMDNDGGYWQGLTDDDDLNEDIDVGRNDTGNEITVTSL